MKKSEFSNLLFFLVLGGMALFGCRQDTLSVNDADQNNLQGIGTQGPGPDAPGPSDGSNSTIPLSIMSFSPTAGDIAGGTSITLTGSGFAKGMTIQVGGKAARITGFNRTSIPNTTTFALPAGSLGKADVVVTLKSVTKTANQKFTYIKSSSGSGGTTSNSGSTSVSGSTTSSSSSSSSIPTRITSFTPTSGSSDGGTVISLTGTGIVCSDPDPEVTVGGKPCPETECLETLIACRVPSGIVGPAVVTLTSNGQSVTAFQQFTYSQGTNPSNTSSTNTGSNTNTNNNSTSNPSVPPAPVEVPVTVSAIAPNTSNLSGGNITITGTGFTDQTQVLMGAMDCPITERSSTQLTCVAPATRYPAQFWVSVRTPQKSDVVFPSSFSYVCSEECKLVLSFANFLVASCPTSGGQFTQATTDTAIQACARNLLSQILEIIL